MHVFATVLAILLISTGLAVLAWPATARMRVSRVGLPPGHPVRTSGVTSFVVPAQLPLRLSRDAQWDRAADVVTQSIARVATVRDLQRSAEQQLDSATYAIQRLFDELSSVMTIAPATPALETAATQVIRPFTPSASRRDAAEAIAA